VLLDTFCVRLLTAPAAVKLDRPVVNVALLARWIVKLAGLTRDAQSPIQRSCKFVAVSRRDRVVVYQEKE